MQFRLSKRRQVRSSGAADGNGRDYDLPGQAPSAEFGYLASCGSEICAFCAGSPSVFAQLELGWNPQLEPASGTHSGGMDAGRHVSACRRDTARAATRFEWRVARDSLDVPRRRIVSGAHRKMNGLAPQHRIESNRSNSAPSLGGSGRSGNPGLHSTSPAGRLRGEDGLRSFVLTSTGRSCHPRCQVTSTSVQPRLAGRQPSSAVGCSG